MNTQVGEEKRLLLVNIRDEDRGSQSPTSIRSRGLFLIELSTALYFLVSSLSDIVLPQYIYDRVARRSTLYANMSPGGSECDVNTSDPIYIAKQVAQESAARWRIYTTMVDNSLSIFSCVILGSSSDRFGRRWLFISPAAGLIGKMAVYAANSHWSLPMWTLLFGHLLNGVSGAFSVAYLGAMLCAADVTDRTNTRSLLVVFASVLVGFMYGAADFSSGYLIHHAGYSVTFVTAAAILASSFVSILTMPETLPCSTDDQSVISHVKAIFTFYTERRPRRRVYLVILMTYTIVALVLLGRDGIRFLYNLNAPFCWDSIKIGEVNGICNIAQSVVAIAAVRLLQCCVGDAGIGAVSVLLASAGFLTTALATTDLHLYIAGALRFSTYLIQEMLLAILSKLASPLQQGVALSSLSAVNGVVALFGSSLFNAIYEVTVALYRGAVFLLMAAVMAASTFGFLAISRLMNKLAPDPPLPADVTT